jgi:hypothetical protein
MPFLLDANFFITAHRTHYPFDVVPSFWHKVEELAAQGAIVSIDKVCSEIKRGNDSLKDWINDKLPSDFFIDSSKYVGEYAQIAQWAAGKSSHYSQGALAEFLDADEADAWLAAAGLNAGHTIVTHEKSNPDMKSRIALPEPCNHFGLPFCNTIDMFRRLGASF